MSKIKKIGDTFEFKGLEFKVIEAPFDGSCIGCSIQKNCISNCRDFFDNGKDCKDYLEDNKIYKCITKESFPF